MDSDIVVVDEIEKSVEEGQINPEPTALPVEEVSVEGAETVKGYKEDKEKMQDEEAKKSEEPEVDKAISVEVEEEDEEDEDEEDEETMKADAPHAISEEDVNATTKMISEISESLTSALSTLAETVKALDAKIEGINKAVAGVANKVEEVEDKFGKRVDAVEKDTAFRKSADLGEILQEEPVIVEKSTWGGRFLTNADLFK